MAVKNLIISYHFLFSLDSQSNGSKIVAHWFSVVTLLTLAGAWQRKHRINRFSVSFAFYHSLPDIIDLNFFILNIDPLNEVTLIFLNAQLHCDNNSVVYQELSYREAFTWLSHN